MSPERPPRRDRKAEHIEIALEAGLQADRNHFDDWEFAHDALPELNRREIDPSTSFLGRRLSAPVLLSCMTGGTARASAINANLAVAAERVGVAIGVGSQRAVIEDPAAVSGFQELRELAPTAPLLANLGAIQLNHGFGVSECRRAVEMIQADALVLHLNPLQEAIQPEGQTDFRGITEKIAAIVNGLDVPVIVKEVGCGLTLAVAERLMSRGIKILDVAGRGGTTWARIEARRAGRAELGEVFADWGLPTPEAIEALSSIDDLVLIGSGGVRHGLDVARAVAIGADLAGMAWPFLAPAMASAEAVEEKLRQTIEELEIAMFCTGSADLEQLRAASWWRRPRRLQSA